MKGQVAIEYLIIVSVAIIVLMPMIIYSSEMIENYNEEAKISLAKNAVKKLGENADWVFSQGQPAKRTTEIYFPEGIYQASVENNTILLRMKILSGISDVYYNTLTPLNGSIPTNSGYYSVSLIAYQNYVNISW